MLDLANHIWINRRLSPRFGRFVARCLCHRRHWLTRVMAFTSTGLLTERLSLIRGAAMRRGLNPYALRTAFMLTPRVRLTLLLFYERRVRTTARTARTSQWSQGY